MKPKVSNNPEKYLTRSDIEKCKITTSYKKKIKLKKIDSKDDFSSEFIDSNWYSRKKKRDV